MKSAPFINNFSAGEFGPLASARTDLDRFGASQELCQNYVPRVQGGVVRRDGSRYVASTKNDGTARLEKFIFSNEQAYILEFGENYIRFYTEGAQITDGVNPIEVTTTYAQADLFELSFCQSNDILYMFHNSYSPKKLIRFSDTSWAISEFLSVRTPFLSYVYENESSQVRAYHAVRPASVSGATALSVTSNIGIDNITAHTTGECKVNFASLHFWISGDTLKISGVSGTTEANGDWRIEVIDEYNIVLKGSVFVNAYVGGADTAAFAPFTTEDVGRYIRIYDTALTPDVGWVTAIITAFTSSIQVSIRIIDNTFNSAAIDYQKWEFGLYCESLGYPSSGCFHESRLYLGGPYQYIAGSRTGDYENFSRSDTDGTVTDSHALVFSLNSNDVNNIRWMAADEKGILVGSSANEWLIKSSSTVDPITPTSVVAKKTTSFGSLQIQPAQVGKATIFTQASGRKVREFNYFYDVDGFRANDVTQLAHHICESGIVQMALSKQPEQIVWCVRDDGQLVGMSYDRDLDGLRVAWHRHIIGGSYNGDIAEVQSVACIPTSDNSYDEVWMIVKRSIDGNLKRFVEYIGAPFDEEYQQDDGFFVDSGLTYYSDAKTINSMNPDDPFEVEITGHGLSENDIIRFYDVKGTTEVNGNIYYVHVVDANNIELRDSDGNNIDGIDFTPYISNGYVRKLVQTISGLTHLDNQIVQACGDGADLGDHTVTAGSITLTNPSAIVHIGLGYESKIKLPRIEAGSQDGTSFGKTRRIHRLAVMLYRSLGLKYGQNFDDMKDFEFSDGDDQINQAPELFSGIKTAEADFEYNTENNICLMQDRPQPSTILAVMPLMQTQDR